MDIMSGAAAEMVPSASGAPGLPGPLNEWLFEQVNTWAEQTRWLHAFLIGFALYGVVVFAGLLLVNWWVARRSGSLVRLAAAVWAPVGVLAAVGVNQAFVAAFHEPRPYTVLPQISVLVARSGDYAFPSDHAVMAGATVAGLWLQGRRARWLRWSAVVAALLMAFARVYVGAHWPGDVAAGLVLGAVISLVGYLLLRTVLLDVLELIARTSARPLLTPTGRGALRPRRGR